MDLVEGADLQEMQSVGNQLFVWLKFWPHVVSRLQCSSDGCVSRFEAEIGGVESWVKER